MKKSWQKSTFMEKEVYSVNDWAPSRHAVEYFFMRFGKMSRRLDHESEKIYYYYFFFFLLFCVFGEL